MYGDNKALLNILPFLIKKGVEPYFVVFSESDFTQILRDLKISYGVYNTSKFGLYPKIRSLRALFGLIRRILFVYHQEYKRLIKDIKSLNPDIIHTNCSSTFVGYYIAKDLYIPHIWHIREYGQLDHGYYRFPNMSSFIKKINDEKNYSISITDDVYSFYKSPQRGVVIYDGVVSKDNINPKLKYNKDSYFLFVGRLVKTKGIEEVIRNFITYNEINDNNSRLLIAGTGTEKYTNILKSICSESKCRDKIEFMGYQQDIKTLMANAKAIIVASNFEAFGLISVEAMLYGCPVIGHNVAGTKCQFDNGNIFTGYEIGLRYNTSEEILDRMEALDSMSEKEILRMIHYSQQTVVEFYEVNKTADKVYQYYLQISKSL